MYKDEVLSAYKEAGIKTASQGSLILMLYDECIKHLEQVIPLLSVEKINPRNIEQINFHIVHVQEVITELSTSLNMEAGGKIAENLLTLYTYFNQQLLNANVQKKVEPLQEVYKHLTELREAWQTISRTIAATEPLSVPSGINIAG